MANYNFINLVGQQFERLTVLERAPDGPGNKTRWLCRCECGNVRIVHAPDLRNGHTMSCGCLRNERTAEAAHKRAPGPSRTPEYRAWFSMLERCLKPEHPAYPGYGGRGIGICKRWRDSFENFLADMGPRKPGLSLERCDNNSGYNPRNCIWTDRTAQCNNKRNNNHIPFKGRIQNVTQWAKELKMSRKVLYERLRIGWSIQRALTQPVRPRGK